MNFSTLLACSVLVAYVVASPLDLSKVTSEDRTLGIDTYLFEGELRDALEELKAKMKENGLEPLPVPHTEFDFFIEDSKLKGYIGDLLCHNVSDFVVDNVEFDVLRFIITLDITFPILYIEGGYKLEGNIFEEILDGEGMFKSNTTDLKLQFLVNVGSNLLHSEIEELDLDFSFVNDYVEFSNTVTGEENGSFDNTYLQRIIYQIRDQYVKLLLNTLRTVGSDLIHDESIEDILELIISIITGGKGKL